MHTFKNAHRRLKMQTVKMTRTMQNIKRATPTPTPIPMSLFFCCSSFDWDSLLSSFGNDVSLVIWGAMKNELVDSNPCNVLLWTSVLSKEVVYVGRGDDSEILLTEINNDDNETRQFDWNYKIENLVSTRKYDWEVCSHRQEKRIVQTHSELEMHCRFHEMNPFHLSLMSYLHLKRKMTNSTKCWTIIIVKI